MKGCRNTAIFVPILVTIFVFIVHYGCGCRGKYENNSQPANCDTLVKVGYDLLHSAKEYQKMFDESFALNKVLINRLDSVNKLLIKERSKSRRYNNVETLTIGQ